MKDYLDYQADNVQRAKDQTALDLTDRNITPEADYGAKIAAIEANDPTLLDIQVNHKPQYGGGPYGNGV